MKPSEGSLTTDVGKALTPHQPVTAQQIHMRHGKLNMCRKQENDWHQWLQRGQEESFKMAMEKVILEAGWARALALYQPAWRPHAELEDDRQSGRKVRRGWNATPVTPCNACLRYASQNSARERGKSGSTGLHRRHGKEIDMAVVKNEFTVRHWQSVSFAPICIA